ncbi:MAG: NADH-quinone oxidoreductase subunit C [Deltaproteobacteria bacterium]|jgi:NADH-quinone oxidoreductase subunit C|nr:NADH-quinone oxidoreductase subunit C [Deltaproteobacteria bacterium]
MPSLDDRIARFKEIGVLAISRHDFSKEGLVLSAVVATYNLLDIAKELFNDGFTLLDVSTLEAAEGFLVTYHFDNMSAPCRIAIRVLAPTDKPTVPSLYPIFQGAEWHERESFDFFGVRFIGNPNLVPLLLPDDFSGPPPLRKSSENVAPLSALGLFGTVETAVPSWENIIAPKTKDA